MKKRFPSSGRRDFLKTTGVVAAGLFANSAVLASPPTAPFPASGESRHASRHADPQSRLQGRHL